MSAFRQSATVEAAIKAGIMFAGTPEQVIEQIRKHFEYVGGNGQLLIMGQVGFLEHDDTVHGIRMFARDVDPELKALYPDTMTSGVEHSATKMASTVSRSNAG